MNDLTKYATLNVDITKFSKPENKSFSLGRARIFYEGPNINRTIITSEVAQQMINSIGGTPIVGRFNSAKDDYEGHGENQAAYGFVPLEPNATKVELTEEILGLPVKRVYYEVDVVIWDGRFQEAAKILGEEKSLSMELNPETVQGEFEVYENKHYVRFTNAEFIGITVLGDDKTPCFKDAKFLQMYSSMLSAYEAFVSEQKSENKIGGTDMSVIKEKVESTEIDTTIVNEEAETEAAETAEVEGTESTEEVAGDAVAEVAEETDFEEEAEAEATGEEAEEDVEAEEEETESNETEESETEEAEAEPEVDNSEVDVLKAQVTELTNKLETYETNAKVELIDKFAKKINDVDFMQSIGNKLADYTVEELKSTLGAKLAEQVLAEETGEKEIPGMNYSYSNLVTKKSDSWVDLVRANKEKK